MGGDPYRNIKTDESKDRIIALLGNVGVGKSSFINAVTKRKECKVGSESTSCTTKIQIVNRVFDDNTYLFIDTPGLDDGKGDEKSIAELEKLRDYPRINYLLICLKYNDIRLSNSVKKALKKFMDIFPAQDFWDHAIIIRTWTEINGKKLEKHKSTYKGKILNGILNDNELIQYMNAKNINYPSNLKEFYVDCIDELEEDTLQEIDQILREIKNKYPIYKNIQIGDDYEIIKEFKKDNINFINIKTERKITFTDFNDKTHEIIEKVNEEQYNLDNKRPLFVEVKRIQDEKPRGPLCYNDQFGTHYIVVKIYEEGFKRLRSENEYTFRYEKKTKEDEAAGEEYRERLQNEFSNTCSLN